MGKLIIFSGAGLSAESGLATFRNSPNGLWMNYPIDKVCNYLTWEDNYDLVHQFYNMRRSELNTVVPNAAHRQIAAWQERYETIVLTQNVDDLLERAGCTDVIHLHGFLPEMTCEACDHVWSIGYQTWNITDRCPQCLVRKGVKPKVVFFNETAPHYRALSATINRLQDDDVVVVSGTSENVIPLGNFLRLQPGFKIFNALEQSVFSDAYNKNLLMSATEAFPLIDTILRDRLSA